ncbi:MAG: RNA polymerase sigma factor, partial [Bacteroidales bacterium]
QHILVTVGLGSDMCGGVTMERRWVWRLSFNTCISAERKKKRREAIPLDIDTDLYDPTDDDGRQIKQLYDRIHRLRPVDRAIVLLWLESMTYEEIASIIGITPKNVSVRLYRIKETLKNMSDQN